MPSIWRPTKIDGAGVAGGIYLFVVAGLPRLFVVEESAVGAEEEVGHLPAVVVFCLGLVGLWV